jgi:hypothetical protein
VSANTGDARSGTLTVAGQAVTVTQAAAPACTFTASPMSQSFSDRGGDGRVTVDASASSCAWTATSNAGWITVTSGGGTGDGDVRYTVSVNTGAARTGTLTAAGQTITISQAAQAPIELNGRISNLSGSCPSISFTLDDRQVRTSAATVFDARCDRIRDRDRLRVTGMVQTDDSVLASRVREEDD